MKNSFSLTLFVALELRASAHELCRSITTSPWMDSSEAYASFFVNWRILSLTFRHHSSFQEFSLEARLL